MYVECGQWYHPRLVIKANISTLCNHSPPHGGTNFPSLSFSFFSSLSTYNKQTICTPFPPLFLSTPMSHTGKTRLKKKRRKKETKRHVESKRCRFLRGQKEKRYEPNQKDRKELGQQETIRWGEEEKRNGRQAGGMGVRNGMRKEKKAMKIEKRETRGADYVAKQCLKS